MAMGKPGPLEITGKFETRQQLVEAIINYVEVQKLQISNVAERCCVSTGTVSGIMKQHREAQRNKVTVTSRGLLSRKW